MKETKRMSLKEVYQKPIKEVLDELEITDLKIYADDDGIVRTIEVIYSNRREESTF